MSACRPEAGGVGFPSSALIQKMMDSEDTTGQIFKKLLTGTATTESLGISGAEFHSWHPNVLRRKPVELP